jgi:hypothetical protein
MGSFPERTDHLSLAPGRKGLVLDGQDDELSTLNL